LLHCRSRRLFRCPFHPSSGRFDERLAHHPAADGSGGRFDERLAHPAADGSGGRFDERVLLVAGRPARHGDARDVKTQRHES